MAYSVYIIYSKSLNRYYKGYTSNLNRRLKEHNSGYSTYTKTGMPWVLILELKKETKSEALVLERKLKNLNRERLKRFIDKYRDN